MSKSRSCHPRRLAIVSLAFATTGIVSAQGIPERSGLAELEFRNSALNISSDVRLPHQLPPQAAAQAAGDLAALGADANGGRIDFRGGRWATLILKEPLLPGSGRGNRLKWSDLGIATPGNRAEFARAAAQAFRAYLLANSAALRIDPDEVDQPGQATVSNGGSLVQIHVPRNYNGLPVRDSYLQGVVNHGNLVLMGANHWGTIDVSPTPDLTHDAALGIVQARVEPYTVNGLWGKSTLVIVPLAEGPDVSQGPPGQGLAHRLAWMIRPAFQGEARNFEALVDAHSGELLSFEDTNHYQSTRRVQGGVFPESNDGNGPEGTEQAGWPMPFAYVDAASGTFVTDAGGNLNQCFDGSIATELAGPFLIMSDGCGAISESSTGDIDLGTSNGTDCTVPAGASPGNTHSSRSGFYEMNRIKEMARSQLPSNSWLQQQLQANMNINAACNAFWDGATVNFYRSGSNCSNTGELAGVFDHEWGHGMDENDSTPGVSNPGEGIADIYAALRLGTSCIGRGFRPAEQCGGYGDPCTSCTGIRDIDYAERASGLPHDVAWINAECPAGGLGQNGPCGGAVHCEGAVYSEAVWDLIHRDLQAAPYNMDYNTALEIGTRLTFLGAGGVGTWFSCNTNGEAGCAATSGYQQYLAADDDNGDLSDGTPHMQAIFEAFDRHGIACSQTPTTPQDSGCSGTPTTAPSVTATALDRGAELSWGGVSGASSYQIFRTDGVFGCNSGKIKVGETTDTSFVDGDLQNGRNYSYIVIPMGPADSCLGPSSACTSVTPVAGPNLAIDGTLAALTIHSGDADDFIDNCETATVTFDIVNSGTGTQNNIQIADVRAISHPGIVIGSQSVAAPSLDLCASTSGSFDFVAAGLSFRDTLVFEVDVTSDELSPLVRTATFSFDNAESDITFVGSQTWEFDDDLEGWTVVQGTFTQNSPGGVANSGYVASSAFLNFQCDQIRSPVIELTPSSTLSVWTNYDIEDHGLFSWYDRANLAFYQLSAGIRSVVAPNGGRLYNAGGGTLFGGFCTDGELGWAGPGASWQESTWSNTVLSGFAGGPVQIELRYSTDELVAGKGFWFDRVTVTDVISIGPDGQDDDCGPASCADDSDCDDGIFCNGAEVCAGGFCEAGVPIDCDDSVSCTNDSCNEQTDSCDNLPDDASCDDGLFCNGAEICDPESGCQAGSAPDCDDGVSCTVDSCDAVTDSCDNLPDDASCDDGLFCNGVETCDPSADCQEGSYPCTGQSCDEDGDVCTGGGCVTDADCDDGSFCNGAEVCSAGSCQAGPAPDCDDGVSCTVDSCNEGTDSCDNLADDGLCDNGLFCDGAETCDPVNDCQPGSDPCTGQTCNETTDSCEGGGSACNNDSFCDSGEDCTTCPGDCPRGPAPGCGNGFCEPGIGEDCLSCPSDCNGKQSGKPSNRFCCGDLDGENPVGCEEEVCSSDGFACSDALPQFCCGDNSCDEGESSSSCELDCGPPPVCSERGVACTLDEDCCSGNCKRNGVCR